MLNPSLERTHIKQPGSIEQYVDKIPELGTRTVIQYDSRWSLFVKKHADKCMAEALPLIVQEIVDAYSDNSIKSSTFRLYRASACYGLATIYMKIENESIDESELESGLSLQVISNLYKRLITFKKKYKEPIDHPDRTSSMKKKSLPKDFYNYLKNISVNEPKNSKLYELWSFVEANLIVGLRPSEWLNARIAYRIEDKVMLLLVKNAKNSNGRANGDERTLILIGITSEKESSLINYFTIFQKKLRAMALQLMADQAVFKDGEEYLLAKQNHVFSHIWDDYEPTALNHRPLSDFCTPDAIPQAGLADLYLRSLQREMHRVYNRFLEENPAVSEKRVTLYSTRHQCIANAKASKVNVFEIAGFFGHSSKETGSRHYGKAWSGWSAFRYKPSLESILAVTDSLDYVKKVYGYEGDALVGLPEIRVVNNDIDFNY